MFCALSACGFFRGNGAPASERAAVGVLATARQPLGSARVAVLPNLPRSDAVRSAAAAKEAAHGTSGGVLRGARLHAPFPSGLGLVPVRRVASPVVFIRDSRRDTSLRNTASSSRAGLAAKTPNAGACARLRRCFATFPSKATLSSAHESPCLTQLDTRPSSRVELAFFLC